MNNITYSKVNQNDVEILVENTLLFGLELSGRQDLKAINTLRVQQINFYSKSLQNKSCIAFIAKYNGAIAGIGILFIREQTGNFKNPSGRWGYIMNMYTLPAYRRKGVCKGILKELIKDASKLGITAFELQATAEGKFVYEQNGFTIYEEPTLRRYI